LNGRGAGAMGGFLRHWSPETAADGTSSFPLSGLVALDLVTVVLALGLVVRVSAMTAVCTVESATSRLNAECAVLVERSMIAPSTGNLVFV
jgi:hypothetical protein